MKKIILEDREYEVVEDYKNGFDLTELEKRYNEYFYDYDCILGDWAYGQLRLKGFCKKGNPLFNNINDYDKVKDYIQIHCAYDCKYFILEKVKEEVN